MAKIRNILIAGVAFGVILGACTDDKPKKTTQASAEEAALKACMDQHRWDTTAVKTSRLAVAINFERMGKGELARHVSDYDAVKLVYCTPKK